MADSEQGSNTHSHMTTDAKQSTRSLQLAADGETRQNGTANVKQRALSCTCVATKTRHLNRLGQLSEFEQESNTDSQQGSNPDSLCIMCVTTETRHLDRLGQLGEFEQDSNTGSVHVCPSVSHPPWPGQCTFLQMICVHRWPSQSTCLICAPHLCIRFVDTFPGPFHD